MKMRAAASSGQAPSVSDVRAFAVDVNYYLSQDPRQLPSRYLYDELGSCLFESICRLPWYAITRAEMRLLAAHGRKILETASPLARIVELGCGSGLLTRHLLDAGHRVIATDASPAMLELARDVADGAEEIRQLVLPDDPIPECDAIVSVGHVLSYLPDEASIDRALVAAARALRPGGVFAIDLCDLRWGEVFREAPSQGRAGDTWAIIS